MVKQLMLAAGTTHDHGFRLKQTIRKPDNGLFPLFAFPDMGIEQKSLKAGHQFISLHHRILIRVKPVLISRLKDIKPFRTAVFHNIIGKLKIPFFRL